MATPAIVGKSPDWFMVGRAHKFPRRHTRWVVHKVDSHCSLEGSTTFVFAGFEHSSFRHDLLPILFRLPLPSDFPEFKRREMGVALILYGKSISEVGTPLDRD